MDASTKGLNKETLRVGAHKGRKQGMIAFTKKRKPVFAGK
jgi:hypothetical protein